MRILLDTHALLWWAEDNKGLTSKGHRAIRTADAVYVSAASAWEITTKIRIGKLLWPAELGTLVAYILGQSFRELPISFEHAERAGQLAIANRDPFDRMLIAQALAEDLTLVSNEAAFDATGVRRLW